ncbi:MAG: phosphoribosyltransferase family protein [Gemmatimonadota bacterium]
MAHVPLPGLPDLAGVPIVPVPTTLRRLRDRGYNQAGVLAATVARATGGILLEALSRMEGGESQVALHPDERRANVKGAFLLRDSSAAEIRGRDILLVDDVLTTGATAVAAAETLGAGGARSVTLLTFARALPG